MIYNVLAMIVFKDPRRQGAAEGDFAGRAPIAFLCIDTELLEDLCQDLLPVGFREPSQFFREDIYQKVGKIKVEIQRFEKFFVLLAQDESAPLASTR